ncbi:MAG: histidine phosphatase family protein [Bauldia litoralis]|uniref:histidine phosphatase family protein n=1 Tax=Bauldia litoralis TaxID=665467 RepID=UPI003299087D
MLPTIVFLRHGETNWNVEGRLQGQRDISLNDNGRAQGKRNGEAIRAAVPDIADFDFVASPLERSRETMEIARLAMGLDPSAFHLDDRLREITFGDWEGFTLAELRATHPDLVAARERDKWSFLPPGGESYEQLSERVQGWLATISRPTMAVSHGGVGRVLRRYLLDLDPQAAVTMSFPQDQAMLIKDGSTEWI